MDEFRMWRRKGCSDDPQEYLLERRPPKKQPTPPQPVRQTRSVDTEQVARQVAEIKKGIDEVNEQLKKGIDCLKRRPW